jgi:ATP-dependent RNA helicase DHX8/PRP22
MLGAEDIMDQLQSLMEGNAMPVVSADGDIVAILKTIVAGFFAKAARTGGKSYLTLSGQNEVHIFPGSAMFGKPAKYVVFHEIVNTTREFMRNVVAVNPEWFVEMAPGFYRRASREEAAQIRRGDYRSFSGR